MTVCCMCVVCVCARARDVAERQRVCTRAVLRNGTVGAASLVSRSEAQTHKHICKSRSLCRCRRVTAHVCETMAPGWARRVRRGEKGESSERGKRSGELTHPCVSRRGATFVRCDAAWPLCRYARLLQRGNDLHGGQSDGDWWCNQCMQCEHRGYFLVLPGGVAGLTQTHTPLHAV